MVARAPASTDELQAVISGLMSVVPGGDEIVEDRVELVLWRIPGLGQVVVDACGVDGTDGGFGVCIRGEEYALRVRVERDGFFEEVDAGHAGHALVGEEEGDDIATLFELLAGVECGLSGCRAEDAVVFSVFSAQVLDDSLKYADVVIYR
jgi:hypothetical protein